MSIAVFRGPELKAILLERHNTPDIQRSKRLGYHLVRTGSRQLKNLSVLVTKHDDDGNQICVVEMVDITVGPGEGLTMYEDWVYTRHPQEEESADTVVGPSPPTATADASMKKKTKAKTSRAMKTTAKKK